jgi:predicted methyltransferase
MTVELHLGDCLDYMRSIPDKSVDAVICLVTLVFNR